jgi:DNA-binding NarL/FixJ family response regulator
LAKVKQKFPTCKVIMLSYHEEPHYIIHLIECGAVGYLQKSGEAEEVILAIRKVMAEGRYFNQKVLELLHDRLSINLKINEKYDFNGQQITSNDVKILELICLQKTTKEIADYLNLSHRTIENHRSSIMKKANVDNIVGLVLYAISKGIFIPNKEF